MNAADILKQAPASGDQRVSDPSMEEILASIRRIIADDQSLPMRPTLGESEAELAFRPAPPIESVPQARAIFAPPAPEATADLPPQADDEPVSADRAAVDAAPSRAPFGTHASDDSLPIKPSGNVSAGSPSLRRSGAQSSPSGRNVEWLQPASVPQVEPSTTQHDAPPAAEPKAHSLGSAASDGTESVAAGGLVSTSTDQSVSAAFNTLVVSRFIDNDEALQEAVRTMLRPMLKAWLDDQLPTLVERLVRVEIERVARGGR